MKYCVLIIDGAAGLPLAERNGQTCLELARTPNFDVMAVESTLGLARTVPPGMEPSSACACMSLMGYDPTIYYKGRASIEAKSLDIDIGKEDVVFRCNLVTVRDGKMFDYSAGHIGTDEAGEIIKALNEEIGNDEVKFYPGVSYRHILKIKGHEETLKATCTPPHDIPGRLVKEYLPRGVGSDSLRDLMARSETLLRGHKINVGREKRGEPPVTAIWLFWGSGQVPDMPAFKKVYGLKAAMTSGVDLLRGLARMVGMDILDIKGVTDGPDNDNAAQAAGALGSLKSHDLVVVHIEAPDEAGHEGDIDGKIEAIQKIDEEVISRLLACRGEALRVLIMPDHPTPIVTRTHNAEPVPFMLWGEGFASNGAKRFTEKEAARTGLFLDPGYSIMSKLVGKK